ncbi:MAG: universal stress protein [Pseudomonadota bacterium]
MWVILVPVANRPESAAALETSFNLAQRLGGSVLGAHIRPHRGDKTAIPDDAMIQDDDSWTMAEGDAATLSVEASDLFSERAKAAGFSVLKKASRNDEKAAYWQERVGTPQYVMPILGPASDMVVVSRPARKESKKARTFMLQAIMRSHRPVLVLPKDNSCPALDHIAIGWNCSPEAARALHAALPVIKSAKKITFITAGNSHDLGPSFGEMSNYLTMHGVEAERHHEGGADSTDALLKAYDTVGADTLLTGAYSQSRWRERLFGGTTERLLHETDIPLLMLHS